MEKPFPFKDFILITGLPRTGTTLAGKVIGSCQQVEYFFEPPLIPTFFHHMAALPTEQIKALFEAYCIQELMNQALSGRRLNFNSNDDSYIGNYKEPASWEQRLLKSYRASELAALSHASIFCMKVPGVAHSLKTIKALYPEIKIVLITRDFNSIARSIRAKGWFNSENPNIIYPSKRVGNDFVPSMVPDPWANQWSDLNEEERIAVYIFSQLEGLETAPKDYVLHYDSFVNDPKIFPNLLDSMGLKYGTKTAPLLESIQAHPYAKFSMASKVRDEIRERAMRFGMV